MMKDNTPLVKTGIKRIELTTYYYLLFILGLPFTLLGIVLGTVYNSYAGLMKDLKKRIDEL